MDEPSAQTQPPEVVVPPAAFTAGEFRVLSPLEKVASYLAAALFALISAVLITIIVDWLLHRPEEPTLTGLKPEEQKLVIENFRTMSDVVWDRTSKAFDLIVAKALLPVFATVVGFLLGKRAT